MVWLGFPGVSPSQLGICDGQVISTEARKPRRRTIRRGRGKRASKDIPPVFSKHVPTPTFDHLPIITSD